MPTLFAPVASQSPTSMSKPPPARSVTLQVRQDLPSSAVCASRTAFSAPASTSRAASSIGGDNVPPPACLRAADPVQRPGQHPPRGLVDRRELLLPRRILAEQGKLRRLALDH